MTDDPICGVIGDWVELLIELLPAGGRLADVPDDTAALPLVMRVRGFLQSPACLEEQAAVRTLAGRLVSGKLHDLAPRYVHSFGRPDPSILPIGGEVRSAEVDS